MSAEIYLLLNHKVEVHAMLAYWAEKGYQIRYTGRKLRLVAIKKPAIVGLPGPRTTSKRK